MVKVLSGPFPGPLLGLMMATVGTTLPLAATVSHGAPGYMYKGTNNLSPPEQPVLLPLLLLPVDVGLVVGLAVAA